MSLLWASLLAVAAATTFALGAYLQQEVASKRPDDEALSLRLIGELATRGRWRAGIALDVVSFGFKALALAFGPLLVVQPVIVSNLLIAVPLSLRRHGLRMSRREWLGCALVAGGLAAVVLAARPGEGRALPSLLGWSVFFAVVAVAGAGALAVGRGLSGPRAAAAIAVAAALVLATQSGLMQATVVLFQRGPGAAFTSWEPYLLAVTSIGALVLVQSAYRAGPLAASMPVIHLVNPLTVVVIGIALYGESFATGTLPLIGAIGGLCTMVVGVVLLDTSPAVGRAHQREQKVKAQTIHAREEELPA